VDEAKQDFGAWSEATLRAVHTQGYRPPPVRRTYIPKPGKREQRPLGVPCVGDRVLQRSVAEVLSAIYEQDFLPCSFGGRPSVGAHHALATLHEVIAGRPVSWVYEADLRNFFGSLDHGWLLRFVQHRVGDPRLLRLIRRWLKAGVLEDGVIEPSDKGVPQGGSVSVVLSNLYLHYVLDLWFDRIVKPRLHGEAYLVRYLDDFVVCFQHRADAERFQRVLVKRLAKFALTLEPNKTRLVAFGRFVERKARGQGKRPETFAFLGLTHYCTRNHQGYSRWSGKPIRRACGAVWQTFISCCSVFDTNRLKRKSYSSIKPCVATMPIMAWRATCEVFSASMTTWSATGAQCSVVAIGRG
jgi:group II intron reverse transcriptase/maturase